MPTSQEIEREIVETRRQMAETVGAIEARISPQRVVDRGLEALRNSAFGHSIRREAADNPYPFLLVAAGLALYAYKETRRRREPEWDIEAEAEPMMYGRPLPGPASEPVLPEDVRPRHRVHLDQARGRQQEPPEAEEIIGRQPSRKSARESAQTFGRG